MIETLAVLGQREREEMLRWYEGKMPREISKGKRDVGLLQLRWMVEKKIEENQGMLKEKVMRDRMKKGVFREENSPNERLDLGKHVGKTFQEVYLRDPEYCDWTMRQEKLSAPKLRHFKFFLKRMEDLTTKNLGICGKTDEGNFGTGFYRYAVRSRWRNWRGRRQGLWKNDARNDWRCKRKNAG